MLWAFLNMSCQTNAQEVLIKNFVIDLFDDDVAPKTVVDTYLEVKKDSTYSKRIKGAVLFIEETRKPVSAEIRGKWIIPNYAIKKIKKPKIYPYKEYKHLSLIKLKKTDTFIGRMYVLLDEDKKEILQYFLLNESKTKIISFCLFIKDGDDGSFFKPY